MVEGSRLHLTDGRGNLFEAEVVTPSARGCEVRVLQTFPDYERRPYSLTMGVAPTKNLDRFEWFLEKATEVGVDVIVPIECANSERRIFRPERGEKIIAGATKQSLKAYMPVLEPITPIKKILTRPFKGVKLIAHCRPESERIPINDALVSGRDTLILIGPEGDFTAEEVELALANGFKAITLGTSRLRTETAAIAATIATYLRN